MTYKEFIDNILNTRGRFNCGEEYHERHHIIPKGCGGSNDKNNLIDLYADEHFVAHKLLAQENPNSYACIYGYVMMAYRKSNNQERDYELTPEEYRDLKIAMAKVNSERQKLIWTEEKRKKQSEKIKSLNKHLSDEHKLKISITHKGKIVSDHTRELISKRNKGRKLTKEQLEARKGLFVGSKNGMFGKTHSDKVKKEQSIRASKQAKGCKWWNNGIKSAFSKECPPGFVPGRMPFKDGNKVGKYDRSNIKRKVKKYKFLDENNNIIEMDMLNKNRWHPNWILIEEVVL